jgi:myo-inositol-1(or 4)-monophosphatase
MGRDKQVELGTSEPRDRGGQGSRRALISRIHEDIQSRHSGRGVRRFRAGVGPASEPLGALDRGEGKWIIDPLDGTTNFAHQYPFFCVSIGFERDGRILCGAVYDPWRDEMFSGARGLGSFVNGQRLRVSDVDTLRSGLIMTGFPYGFREKIKIAMGQFEAFMIESQAVRRGGSAALDLCYTALGRVDGFWEMDLHPWDTAAGLVILEEAGGRVTDFGGGDFSVYGKQVLASNGKIHDEMAGVLAGVSTEASE